MSLSLAAGCTEKLDSLQLPGVTLPLTDTAATAPAKAAPRPKAARGAPARAGAPLAVDCDELPSPEEEARAKLPPQPGLGKAIVTDPSAAPTYELLPGVELSDKATAKLSALDRAYAQRTREHLVVTSGTRDANRQARAMYVKLRLGDDLLRLYRNKAAVQEIIKAYQSASGRPAEEVVTAMEAVIRDQIERDIYVSAHLRSGAVDVRSRTMSPREKRAFVESAAVVGDVRWVEELKPEHYHLQID